MLGAANGTLLFALIVYIPESSGMHCIMSRVTKPKSWEARTLDPMVMLSIVFKNEDARHGRSGCDVAGSSSFGNGPALWRNRYARARIDRWSVFWIFHLNVNGALM